MERREAKPALLEALRRALRGGPHGWRVEAERPLTDSQRRPDGLAELAASGIFVAFEVQYADRSEGEGRERPRDRA